MLCTVKAFQKRWKCMMVVSFGPIVFFRAHTNLMTRSPALLIIPLTLLDVAKRVHIWLANKSNKIRKPALRCRRKIARVGWFNGFILRGSRKRRKIPGIPPNWRAGLVAWLNRENDGQKNRQSVSHSFAGRLTFTFAQFYLISFNHIREPILWENWKSDPYLSPANAIVLAASHWTMKLFKCHSSVRQCALMLDRTEGNAATYRNRGEIQLSSAMSY